MTTHCGRAAVLLATVTVFSLSVTKSLTAVFDMGPSDPGLFDVVTNVPTDPDIPDDADFGGGSQFVQLNVADGGTVGNNVEALANAEINISGGSVGSSVGANGGEINISEGVVGGGLTAINGGMISITGGTVGSAATVFGGSQFDHSGGILGAPGGVFNLFGGVLNLSGGTLNDAISGTNGSELNIFGTAFILDGVPLDSLVFNQATVINTRDVTLNGTLADGSPFSFDLNTSAPFGEDFIPSTVNLTVTLVPEPSSLAFVVIGTALFFRRRRVS